MMRDFSKYADENSKPNADLYNKFHIDFLSTERYTLTVNKFHFSLIFSFQKRIVWLNIHHIIQAFFHIIQAFLGFIIMLIFMTFNVWLCLSILIGAGFGYLVFASKRLNPVDTFSVCH